MIREIINFTKTIDADLKEVIEECITPQQEGLYIVFSENGSFNLQYYKEGHKITPLLKQCTERLRHSWTIEYDKKPYYQKCFDLPNKRIHSVSPFLVAVKRKYLEGGKEFFSKRVDLDYMQKYLDKAVLETIHDKDLEEIALKFKNCISNNYDQIIQALNDFKWTTNDYVLIFFETSINNYKSTYSNYLKTRVFPDFDS